MLALSLVFLSSLFGEAGASVGKHEVAMRKESMYSLGFLNLIWGTVFFFAYSLVSETAFVFDPASLPTFALRVALEIAIAYLAVHAIVLADRSTFGFLRILTIPLLLLVDVQLGYALTAEQVLGMGVIAIGLVFLFVNHGIKRRGALYVVGGALLAVVTISLYKYDITHYNSVAAEQGITSLFVMTFYYLMARATARENPLVLMRAPVMLGQSLASGVNQAFLSFAYVFAPASLITAAARAFSALAAMVSGDVYFKEKHVVLKAVAFVILAAGIILLA